MAEPAEKRMVVMLTVDELEQVVDRAVGKALSANRPAEEDLWDLERVARFIGCDPKTVVAYVRTQKLPGAKHPCGWRFVPGEVRAWQAARALESRKHTGKHGKKLRTEEV